MAAQGSLYPSHYCIRQVKSVQKGLVIISEVCVCANCAKGKYTKFMGNYWSRMDCAKGKILNCVLLQLQYYYGSNKLTIEQLKATVNMQLLTVITPHKECITVFNSTNEAIWCYTRATISWINYTQQSD